MRIRALQAVERFSVARLMGLSNRFLPFADAATSELPLRRLLRLGLFQISVGMATALLTGTLNRVMIVELKQPASFVALLVSIPLVFAPLRALIGHRSDQHRSVLGWRRVPYLWIGTMLQFGGLAIMPFALLLLTGDRNGSIAAGVLGSSLAFLMVGAGIHTAQTAGLALATDLASPRARPRVVGLLYLMLLVGAIGSSLVFGQLLIDYSPTRLAQVVQSAAVLAMGLNLAALWKQEPRGRPRTEPEVPFQVRWRAFASEPGVARLLLAVAVGGAGFAMQDVLLEPFGGEVLGLAVGATTRLTGLMALGALGALGLAARSIERGADPLRMAGVGAVVGLFSLGGVIFAAPLQQVGLLMGSSALLGFANALFAIGTMTAVMGAGRGQRHGIALGAWGAVQATAAGVAAVVGGVIRDGISAAAARGWLGPAFGGRGAGYLFVFGLEMALLVATLAVIGPLVRPLGATPPADDGARFGLAELPG